MDFQSASLAPPGVTGVTIPPPPSTSAAVLLDPDFEPQTRLRSNTWPCQRPEDNNNCSPGSSGEQHQGQLLSSPPDQTSTEHLMGSSGLLLPKKSSSRRNAWGNLSYADLITQAISSSPEKRLTLSQIYDWMVTNVPYFKDKGDSNSSAGWKNSIRHNLSLHNKFIRVQNEGTGKSSWWMLNPDAKPGKAARRRATSMETSKYEKRRGRIRKRIEALKNGTTVLDTPSPCSSLGEGLDVFPGSDESPSVLHSFSQLSPDFRPRASSNASSCGRLSPILGVNEPVIDLHDNQVPPMSPWNLDYSPFVPSSTNSYASSNLSSSDRFGAEQLAGSLANTMKLNDTNCFLPGAVQPTPVPVTEFNNTPYVLQNFQQAQPSDSTNSANSSFQHVGANGGATGGYVKLEPSREHQDYYPNYSQLHDSKLQSIPSSSDLDFNIELGQFDCDVDEVLQTELNLGGDIDFNFGNSMSNVVTTQSGPSTVSHLHNGGTMTLGNIVNGAGSIQHAGPPTSLIHHHASNTTPTTTSAFNNHQQAMVGPPGQQWVH
ncbi:unnamed protein product [Orchesella dallaii]|uniref:Forkhead box protein O n=1 Tax=Orchesella dallaii TaxID=48710 RepID=A0ABP1QMS5_9HEXA